MACEEWRGQLDRYLDGELTPAEAAAVGAHLRGCADCAAGALERVQTKRLVQAAGKRHQPSAALRNQITKSVAARSHGGSARQWKLVLIPGLVLAVDEAISRSRRSAYGQRGKVSTASWPICTWLL